MPVGVRIVIGPVAEQANVTLAQPNNKQSKANFNLEQRGGRLGISNSDPHRTTQGLWYIWYGMDEGRQNNRRRRYVLEPPASWRLRLIARSACFFADRPDAADASRSSCAKLITTQQALHQAMAALWLLCKFGGVGSKARKGFGSLAIDGFDGWMLENCRQAAQELRSVLGLPNGFNERYAHSSSLYQMLGPVKVVFSWPNVWHVLDQVGFAYQAFAKRYKHRREKMALGCRGGSGALFKGRLSPRLRSRQTAGTHRPFTSTSDGTTADGSFAPLRFRPPTCQTSRPAAIS